MTEHQYEANFCYYALGMPTRQIASLTTVGKSTMHNWVNPKSKEMRIKQNRKWRVDNPDKVAPLRHKNRIQAAGLLDEYIPNQQKIVAMYECAYRMSLATGTLYEIDHIRPLSQGGEHIYENLQILPRKDNRSKCNRWDATYYLNTIFND